MAPATTPAQILEERLSVARLRPYRTAVGGDLDQAITLYAWNTLAAGAFFEDLGHLEVILRNALHHEMEAWHTRVGRPRQWYDDPARLLDDHRLEDIRAARQRIARRREVETPGKVLAELTFGFWRFLLDKKYQTTIWAPALRHAFPHLHPQNRATVYQPVDRLHGLRNRIAHHEPIHHYSLADRHDDLLRAAGFIDPVIEGWLLDNSRVPQILVTRPPTPSRR